ncbi:MAG: PQQ-like beta-propeller repeat protein, partial [Lentisphaeria bacterium]|nr:PQQ-like beta-propeller repeat protein [Lentisphaeria bacterium]
MTKLLFSLRFAACAALTYGSLWAADWQTFRGDGNRSAYTPDKLPTALSLRWVHKTRHSPRPAWSGRDTRMPFDAVFHPVVAGDRLFFGSSADGKVYALDTATGKEQWSFFTGGPIRFAPLVWQSKVFVASDDGFLYCLAAEGQGSWFGRRTGKLLWKMQGGPIESMLLGNDRMISRWPARGGPVIADGTLYFAAGIWPSEGIFLYALDAATGRKLWCKDSAGSIFMAQPHGGSYAKSGISAQGHLVVNGDQVLVPTGRAVPAAFGRADGKLRYFHLQKYSGHGGSSMVSAGPVFFHSNSVFNTATGHLELKGLSKGAHTK